MRVLNIQHCKILKKSYSQPVKVLCCLLFIFCGPVFADTTGAVSSSNPTVTTQPAITTPQKIPFENCTKIFAVNNEKLFYLTLGAISANNFIVEEIQTENGYIIFYAARNKYLATIASVDAQNSIIKITPCNEYYVFPPGVLLNIFKYIELNLNTELK